jgi:hypothetical protein
MSDTTNLIEIDLNQYLLIKIPTPFNKEQLVNILADYYEYRESITETVKNTFIGTEEEFNIFMLNKNTIYTIVTNNIENNLITYDEVINTPNKLSKTEFAIGKFLKASTDNLISILTELQVKDIEAQKLKEIEDLKTAVNLQFEALRNTNLV